MQDNFKSKSISSSNEQAKIQQNNGQIIQEASCGVPDHLQQAHQIHRLTEQSTNKILQSSKFKLAQEFKSNIDIQIIQTNFESMRVMLHYGKFKIELAVIYTEIQEKIFQDLNSAKGSFGVVKFVQFQGRSYAIKGVPIEYAEDEINTERAYKEYFLCCLADVLGIGPKIYPLFGYDILLTKNMVFFAMEKCQWNLQESGQTLKAQLLKSLQIMHSINFIHIDIKPDNLAYSPRLRKHVFIDFGLSKLIKELPGQKSKTKFAGTISFCSEEMKKCYYFQTSKLVDLYQNDLCCLEKTVSRICYAKEKFNLEEQNEEMRKVNFFEQIIEIIRLKYYVETENLSGVLKILENNQNNLHKTIYGIFTRYEISDFLQQNHEIQKRLKLIKHRLFNSGFGIETSDNLLCQFFSQSQREISAEKIIPISQIIQSKPQFFNRYLVKTDLILKLFHFFQPFSLNYYPIQSKIEMKRIIVQRIFDFKQPGCTSPLFFSEKVRFALIFFHENLKNLKNFKVLCWLRLLFIAVQDWANMERLENQILPLIQQPFVKILKAIEFVLFRTIILQQNKKQKIFLDLELIQTTKIRQIKLKSLLTMIITKPNHFGCQLEQKMQIINQINQISDLCLSAEEKQSIYNIKYIYIDLCRIDRSVLSWEAPAGLQLSIYSRISNSMKVQLKKLEQQEKFFWPLRFEIKSQFIDFLPCLLTLQDHAYFLATNRTKELMDPLSALINKQILFYLAQKIRQENSDNQVSTRFLAFRRIAYLNFLLEFILKKYRYIDQHQKQKKQQKMCLLNQIQTIFNQFIESQTMKPLLKQSFELQIYIVVIQAKFDFQSGKSTEEMKSQLSSIMETLKPSLFQHPNLILHFLSLSQYFILELQQQRHHYFKLMQVDIAQQYIRRKDFSIYQKSIAPLASYVRFKNQQGKSLESLQMILSLMQHLRKRKINAGFTTKQQNQLFLCLVLMFFNSLLPKDQLKLYFLRRFQKIQFECGFQAYFLYSNFISIRNQIDSVEKLKQLTRTTLCIKNMPSIFQIKVRSEIFKHFRSLIKYKSKRKALICRRSEIRHSYQNKLAIFSDEMQKKVEKIKITKKNNKEQIYLKLTSKIQKLSKL